MTDLAHRRSKAEVVSDIDYVLDTFANDAGQVNPSKMRSVMVIDNAVEITILKIRGGEVLLRYRVCEDPPKEVWFKTRTTLQLTVIGQAK